jgi:hypothetical protein
MASNKYSGVSQTEAESEAQLPTWIACKPFRAINARSGDYPIRRPVELFGELVYDFAVPLSEKWSYFSQVRYYPVTPIGW